MADNVQVTAGSGTTIAADEVTIDGALAKVQRVKPVFGAPGSGADADIGPGTGGAATQRVAIDSSQISAVGQQLSAASVSTVPASDAPAQRVSQDTNVLLNGNTALTPKFKVITASSSGATTIVALVASKKIRVLAWDIKVNAAVNFKWQSHVTPTDLTGLYYNSGQGDGVARAFNPLGYFETVAGEALDINLSGAVAVGGVLTYVEV